MKVSRRPTKPRPRLLLDPLLWVVAAVATLLLARLVFSILDELPRLMELK